MVQRRLLLDIRPWVIAFLVIALASYATDATRAASPSLTTPDSLGIGSISLVLDASDRPVVAYNDRVSGELRLLHCNDVACAPGGDSITIPDTAGHTGFQTSLELDSAGDPVVSYVDNEANHLKLLHCNDANCAPGGDVISLVAKEVSSGGARAGTSLALGPNPVIGYIRSVHPERYMRVIRCNDPDCAPGGEAGLTINSPTSLLQDSSHPQVAIPGSGGYTVSYDDSGGFNTKHCVGSSCSGGPISAGHPGPLRLDANGFPVVAMYSPSENALQLLHCNDSACAGNDDSISTLESLGDDFAGERSLVLDAAGNPVISYYTSPSSDLYVVHCNDANCAGGDDVATRVAFDGDAGSLNSIAVDESGFPVVAFFNETEDTLKILRCVDASCATAGAVGGISEVTNAPVPAGSSKLLPIGIVSLGAVLLSLATGFALVQRSRAI